jgi:hypothetical protein
MLAGILGAPIFPIGTLVGGLLYLAGSGAIGLRLLRMTDTEWSGGAVVQEAADKSASGNLADTR